MPLETKVQERNSGKTNKIKVILEHDSDAIVLVPFVQMKEHYSDFKDRVHTMDDLVYGRLRGIRTKNLIIDEGYLYSKDRLAQFYYALGKTDFNVTVYGSIEG